MPRKSLAARTKYQRETRARKRAERKLHLPGMEPGPDLPADVAGAIAAFSSDDLVIPPGHPRQGQPFELEPYALAFLKDVFKDGITEGFLGVGRKNGKTATIGNCILAFLADTGPCRQMGFRAGVLSLSKDKSAELKLAMQTTAEASGLKGIRFLRSPAPGRVESKWGTLDLISTDVGAHSAGYSLVVIDDIGFMEERHRDLIGTVRSAVSARAGLLLSMSATGFGPFVPEILERRGDPSLAVHLHQADAGAALDDEAAWLAANPSLGRVKQWSYMRSESRRVQTSVKDQATFRAYDMNQTAQPETETLVPADAWARCVTDDPPEPSGDCFIGLDCGGSVSMTAAAIFFPDSGLLEVIGGFPSEPDLKKRGAADNSNYLEMERNGELIVAGQFTTDLAPIIQHVADRLRKYGCRVIGACADKYRDTEVIEAMHSAKVAWKMDWRRTGSGQHGIEDVRFFKKAVLDRAVKSGPSNLMIEAVRGSVVRYDEQNNPVLNKRRANSRIDALSASILCVGAAYRRAAKPKPKREVVSYSLEQLESLSA